jgi:hypothetical protein
MSIPKEQYEYFLEQGIPYEGEVEGVGQAYQGDSVSVYPINKSQTEMFYLVDTVNVLVVDTTSNRIAPSAAMEAKIEADLKRFHTNLQTGLDELRKMLEDQARAETAVLEAKAKEAEAAREARLAIEVKKAEEAAKAKAVEAETKAKTEKATAEKARADRTAIGKAELLKKMTEELYKFAARVSTRVDPGYLKVFLAPLINLKNQTSDDKIKSALDTVAEYIGTEYKQQTGVLRTDSTEEALKYMDCTEFAARFLQIVCGLEKTPSFSTQMLAPYADKNKIYQNFMKYVEGSDATDFTDIQPGDIFLWRTDSSGHVGVVISYDPEKDYVYIEEALTRGAEASLNGGKGELKNQVRRSTYTRTGKALAGHTGWKGYFRPIVNTK